MAVYKLSDDADRRLMEIYEHSLAHFGEAQADRFYLSLHETFQRLADMPGMGRPFHEYRRHEHPPYAIFYESEADGILIAQIYHHSEDIARKLT